ncbi:MAG: hypothetical protein DMG20_00480 [Acidobacteria bacterium]|nr:MAG: hypothetical protein DMG20_00480 [Acidobacteriota bacterium]
MVNAIRRNGAVLYARLSGIATLSLWGGRRDSHAEREPDRAKPQELPGAPGEGHRFRQISRFEREFIHIFSGEE